MYVYTCISRSNMFFDYQKIDTISKSKAANTRCGCCRRRGNNGKIMKGCRHKHTSIENAEEVFLVRTTITGTVMGLASVAFASEIP